MKHKRFSIHMHWPEDTEAVESNSRNHVDLNREGVLRRQSARDAK